MERYLLQWTIYEPVHYLFLNILKIRVQQFYEDGHCSSLNHRLCLQGCSWRNVGQRPGGFKLQQHDKAEKQA